MHDELGRTSMSTVRTGCMNFSLIYTLRQVSNTVRVTASSIFVYVLYQV